MSPDRGSRLRLRQWLGERRAEFEQRLLEASPSLARSRRGLIRWLGPDDDVWSLVFGEQTPERDGVAPGEWDAAGIVPSHEAAPGLVLVAARSRVSELDAADLETALDLLAYLGERRGQPTWLVNAYFTGGRLLSGPDTPAAWHQAIEESQRGLGARAETERFIHLYLPDGAS
jgi:hypothetical protein